MEIELVDDATVNQAEKDETQFDNDYIRQISKENPGFYFLGRPERWADSVTAVCEQCGTRMRCAASYFSTTKSCVHCGKKTATSFAECFILAAFEQQAGSHEVRHRDLSAIGMELDIYVPSKRFAIEPGSWTVHCRPRTQARDEEKRRKCAELGIRLITIYDLCHEEIDGQDILTYSNYLAVEKGLISLKELTNWLLSEAGFAQINEHDWIAIITRAQCMTDAITTEIFADRIRSNHPDYEVIGKYVNKKTPVDIICHKHDVRFSALPATLYKGIGCPKCFEDATRLSNEDFVRRLKSISPDIAVLDEYTKGTERVRCKCLIDGYEWNTTAESLLAGHGCPQCGNRATGMALRRNQDDVIKKIEEEHSNIQYVSGYHLVHSKATFRCTECGNVWQTTPHHLLAGQTCPECARKSRITQHRLTEEEFAKRIQELYPGYVISSPYTGYYDTITLTCPNGHDHTLQATTFLNKPHLGSCPQCRKNLAKDDIDEDTLRREYIDEGLIIEQIGQRHNRSHMYVDRRLKLYGIEKRPPRRPVSIREDELRKMYITEGKSLTDLEKHFGCSRPTIYKYMRLYGIEKRRSK